MNNLYIKISLFVLIVITISCDRDKNNPGYDYFPDMAYSRAYETYNPNPNFYDGSTLRMPVDGSISREQEIYPYKRSEEDMIKASSIINPLKFDPPNIKRGKEVYERICLNCHGSNGDGKGHLFTSGKYPFPPANLLSPKTVNRTDGQLFHVITVGYGIMEPHGVIVRPDDRWKVILYIRNLQDSLISK